MSDESRVPVYPSQLSIFKQLAQDIATVAENHGLGKPLSAFKRNDALARALGYKGHSDLVIATRFRAQADPFTRLVVFNDPALIPKVAREFAAACPGTGELFFNGVCTSLKDENSLTLWELWGYQLRSVVLEANQHFPASEAPAVLSDLRQLEPALRMWKEGRLPAGPGEELAAIFEKLPTLPQSVFASWEPNGDIPSVARDHYGYLVSACADIMDRELGKKNPFPLKRAAH